MKHFLSRLWQPQRVLPLLVFALIALPGKAQDDITYGCDSFLVEETFLGIGDAFYTDYFTNFSTLMYRGLFQDNNGVLHLAYVANYELFYYRSEDGGKTWTGEQIITGQEGNIYRAVIAADQNSEPFIAYTYNSYFNYGNPTGISFGQEFRYDAALALKEAGVWVNETFYTSSSNHGFKVNDLRVQDDGTVTVYGHRYGWSTYGGEVWAMTRGAGDWSGLDILQSYSDVSIDRFLAKVLYHEAPDGTQTLIYGRNTNPAGYPEVAAIQHDGSVWNSPIVVSNKIANTAAWDWTYNTDGTLWTIAFDNEADPPLLLSTDLAPAVPFDLGLPPDMDVTIARIHLDANQLLNVAIWFAESDSVWVYVSPDSGATWCAPFYEDKARFGSLYPAVNGAANVLPMYGYPIISRVSPVEPYGPDSLYFGWVSHGDTTTAPSGLPSAEGLAWDMQLYPNPSRGLATLTWNMTEAAEWQIRLWDAQGRLMQSRELGTLSPGQASIQLDLSAHPTGTYWVEIAATDGRGNRQFETKSLLNLR